MIALRSQAGFTLAELLVALAVTAIGIAAATLAFQVGHNTIVATTDQIEAQEKVRWGLERMVQEIRGAGLDACQLPLCPKGPPHFDAITDQAPTTLTIQNDLNGNGLIDPPAGPCDPAAATERVRYRLVGSQLLRSTNPANEACETPVVSGVTALTFEYRDHADNVTADASAIRTVRVVALTIASENGGAERSTTMADRVRIRNR